MKCEHCDVVAGVGRCYEAVQSPQPGHIHHVFHCGQGGQQDPVHVLRAKGEFCPLLLLSSQATSQGSPNCAFLHPVCARSPKKHTRNSRRGSCEALNLKRAGPWTHIICGIMCTVSINVTDCLWFPYRINKMVHLARF